MEVIYIMTDFRKIKVGISNNAERRSKEAKAVVVMAIPVPYARGVEHAFHSVMRVYRIKKYRSYSGHSEWFHIFNILTPLAVFCFTDNYIWAAASAFFLPVDAIFVVMLASAISWLTAFIYGAAIASILLAIYIITQYIHA